MSRRPSSQRSTGSPRAHHRRQLPDVLRHVGEVAADHARSTRASLARDLVDGAGEIHGERGAAEVLLVDLLAERALDHRRAGGEDLARALHHHRPVREDRAPGGPAGGGAHARRTPPAPCPSAAPSARSRARRGTPSGRAAVMEVTLPPAPSIRLTSGMRYSCARSSTKPPWPPFLRSPLQLVPPRMVKSSPPTATGRPSIMREPHHVGRGRHADELAVRRSGPCR